MLVTGGAGYIGSHTVVEMLASDKGFKPVILDNLGNASISVLRRIEDITGCRVEFEKCDITNKTMVQEVFKKYNFHSVIHFAALKAVGESMQIPLAYYRVNVAGTLVLLEVMKEFNVRNIIFSSSATVYGTPQFLPFTEGHPTGNCSNVYGRTKYFIEEIMKDLWQAENSGGRHWNVILLRYFNPVGAHASSKIGEDPNGIPNNLMPFVCQVAVGKRSELLVYGSDYDTPDGTGVRDYIHVVDLALGHIAALKKLQDSPGLKTYNLGTGNGYSVLEVIRSMEKASGKTIPYRLVARRPGDIAIGYSDASLAKTELNWEADRTLDEMCQSAWNWQRLNPSGYSNAATETPN